MARGGYGHGSGVPLRDRVRAGQAGGAAAAGPSGTAPQAAQRPAEEPPEDPAPSPVGAPYPGKHCWVTVPVDGPRPRPGLLLEWRRVGHRWEGRVTYVAELRPGRWATVEEWVPAELLSADRL